VCYLQLAQQELGATAWAYWLPIQLAVTSLADTLRPVAELSRSEQSPMVTHYLNQAHHALTQATQADPHYAPGWINLAISAWYQNEIFAARAAIEKARQLTPDAPAVQGLRALILQAEGFGTDTWSQAVTVLQALTQNTPAEPIWLYNTAQLLAQRGRVAAVPYWERLAQQVPQLPPPVRQVVCEQVACPSSPEPVPPLTLAWELPLAVGTYLKRSPDAQRVLSHWSSVPFDWQKAVYGTIYQAEDGSAAVLELAGYAEMVVLYQPHIALDTLAAQCPVPLHRQTVVAGEIWHCQRWSALVQAEQVQELWVVAH
jgi:tetratricopeptide (TPR) repeat protein